MEVVAHLDQTPTAQSDVGRLLRVAMKHPKDAFLSQDTIDAQWRALNFLAPPDFRDACRQFDRLVRLLEDNGVGVELLAPDDRTGLDSIYTRDASVPTDRGIVLCRMGKPLRAGEPEAQAEAFCVLGLEVIGSIEAPGALEGGDLTWLDRRTLVVGQGYRTNAEGIRQLQALAGAAVDEVITVPLPHWKGPSDVMHLMSLLSPVDTRLSVVFSPLLPVPFRQILLERGYGLVEVPEEEFDTMGTNVLAIAPGIVVVLDGNPRTRAALERAGVHTLAYAGSEISMKGSGGPTCLTRPLERE